MKKYIVIPIFNDEYKVIVCWGNLRLIKRLMRDWGFDVLAEQKDLDSRRGVTFYAKECHPLIALPAYPKSPAEIGTLAHEATHAVTNIFEKLDERTYDEAFAHSVGAVVRTVLKVKRK